MQGRFDVLFGWRLAMTDAPTDATAAWLVKALSCEGVDYPEGRRYRKLYRLLVSFRHLNQSARLAAATRFLEHAVVANSADARV